MNWKTDARTGVGAFSKILASAVKDAARGAATTTGGALAGERAQGIARSAVGLAIDTAFGSAQAAAAPIGKVAPILLGNQAREVNEGVAKLAEQTQAGITAHVGGKAVATLVAAGEYLQKIGKKEEE